jgi:hypothetical protein
MFLPDALVPLGGYIRHTGYQDRFWRLFDVQQVKSASLEKVVWQMPAAVIVVEAPSG